MKNNLLAALCILHLIAIAILGNAFAQTMTVGVSPGDSFDYSYSFLWESTDQTGTIPAEYMDLSNTQSIRITIISVQGSLINMDVTKYFRNGTENTTNGNTDVDRQIVEAPYAFLVIRSNANPDEKIYPSGGHALFSEIEIRNYTVGEIETIHFLTVDSFGEDYEKIEIFFHRAIGVAAEYQYESRETSGAYVTTIRETLILERVTLGNQTGFLLYTVPIIIAVALLLILVLLRRKRRTHSSKARQHNNPDYAKEEVEE